MPDGGDLISSSELPSNKPNTFSVLNVKISIELHRNPQYSRTIHTQTTIIIQLWRTSPRTWLDASLRCDWGSGLASCSRPNRSTPSQAKSLPLLRPEICWGGRIFTITRKFKTKGLKKKILLGLFELKLSELWIYDWPSLISLYRQWCPQNDGYLTYISQIQLSNSFS